MKLSRQPSSPTRIARNPLDSEESYISNEEPRQNAKTQIPQLTTAKHFSKIVYFAKILTPQQTDAISYPRAYYA